MAYAGKPPVQRSRRPAPNHDERPRPAPQSRQADAIDQGARVTAQRAQLRRLFGAAAETKTGPAPVQRRILVDGSDYPVTEESSQAVRDAAQDEFIRYYESEQEVIDHLDNKAPTSFGLVKERALWYRIPLLGREFFVFGESHAAVRGEVIKAQSNITLPILNEKILGWSVGEALGDGVKDVGVDENASKLMRALERWTPGEASKPTSDTPPKIPHGEASTRDRKGGTYRLVVPDEDGKASWWKPHGQMDAPTSTHNPETETLTAIRELFPLVFSKEIAGKTLDAVEPNAQLSWDRFPTKPWDGRPNTLRNRVNIKDTLLAAAGTKTSGEYAKLHSTETLAEDKTNWTADEYRNEFMFVRILEAAAKGGYAFATIGGWHLQELQGRLDAKGIPSVTMADFFDRYSQDAVKTR